MNKSYPIWINVLLLVVVLFPMFASAQQMALFAEKPSARQEFVQAAREKAYMEKVEAEQWALANNCPVRIDDGNTISELIAIRDGRPIYFTTENLDAAISTGADLVRNTAPYNVDGSGLTVGIWDGGSILSTHQEFSGGRVSIEDGASGSWHATHVGGTIGAAGVNSYAQGMVPGSLISSYDWNSDTSEMGLAAAAIPNQTGRIYLSNHSYGSVSGWATGSWSGSSGPHFFGTVTYPGDEGFGQYNSLASDYDSVVYNAPYFLPFKSAGNDRTDSAPSIGTTFYYWSSGWKSKVYGSGDPAGDGVYKFGYDTIGSRGNAKNIMTVGAVDDAVLGGERSADDADITSFSGWGPSDDGRIKPDIVANGLSLYSCDNDHNADYYVSSGTSMSSPNACGSAALLVDFFDNLFPGDAMRASTLKGLIINTTDDVGRSGPDYSYGWGLMNTLKSAVHIRKYYEGETNRMIEASLNNGETHNYNITRNGAGSIRVTLCWTDPPATPATAYDSRASKLINDLDLVITGPGGSTYYPYKLNYANPTADATATGENDIDNVEQVYIPSSPAGTYTVSVNYDGSVGAGVAQWYSLIVDPNYVTYMDDDADGLPDEWESQYFGNATNGIVTADDDGDGINNWLEYVAGTIPTNAASFFAITSFSTPPTGNTSPSQISWPTVSGRVYSVSWTDNLLYKDFTVIQDDIPSTQSSYMDSVSRPASHNFYKVDVRMQ